VGYHAIPRDAWASSDFALQNRDQPRNFRRQFLPGAKIACLYGLKGNRDQTRNFG
jgi:soluble lytic murein transglycosylase-like protein